METQDSTGDQAVQEVVFQESFLVKTATFCRKASQEFGWPMLLLYYFGPKEAALATGPLLGVYVVLGAPIILCGVFLRLWSKGYYRKDGFVIDGPYRYVRNPVELGALFVYAGAAILLALPWWYNFLIVCVGIVYLSFAGLAYDQELSIRFGTTYLRYIRRVHRWLPAGLPGTNRSNRTFSLMHALWNETPTLLWICGYVLVAGLRARSRF